MFWGDAFEAREHQAHQVQAAELLVGQGTQHILFIGRSVVETVPAQHRNFLGDGTDLIRCQGIKLLEGIQEQ